MQTFYYKYRKNVVSYFVFSDLFCYFAYKFKTLNTEHLCYLCKN